MRLGLPKKLLPNTRLIIEPKIAGCAVVMIYEEGVLKSAITNDGLEKKQIFLVENVPKKLPILKTIRIQGKLYAPGCSSIDSKRITKLVLCGQSSKSPRPQEINFSAFQILNADLNQYSQFQELKRLGFEVPPIEFTRFRTNEVEVYRSLWRDQKIFTEIPTDGIVLKVNSRKLQKQLGESNASLNWACAITS